MVNRAIFRVLVGLVSALSVVLSSCSALTTSFQPPTLPPYTTVTAPVVATDQASKTVVVQRGDVVRTATFQAQIVSQTETTLQFPIAGMVAKLMVEPGSLVKKGDLLAQLDSSVSDYDLKLAESNLEKANLVYQQTLKNTPTSQPGFKETIELKKIDVDQAQLALNDLKRKFETASLISPVDGKVQHVYINLGDTVVPFKPVVVLADPDHIEVRAEVSAADFAKLTEKMPVMISLANDTTVVYSGYIRQLTSVANNSKQTSAPMIYFARIAFNDNPPEIVKIGAFGSVQINVEKKLGVLWLPPNALQGVSPSQYVNLKDGNKTVKVYIRTGLSTKERVEITQGLSDGQVIILP